MAETARLSIESGPEALVRADVRPAEPAVTQFRVLAPVVGCRTGNSLGVGGSAFMSVQVDRGGLLPVDAPVQDVARLLRKGAVEALGEIPPDVRSELDRLDAEAEARRAPVPVLSPRDRLANALAYTGLSANALTEAVDAIERLIDERVRVALEEVRADATSDR
jgi:hypothetical protein